jgi:3-oxoacyl-[acyl-carrier-protein] synthase-1
MALYASWEALVTAGLTPEDVRGTNLAVLVGSGSGSAVKTFDACNSFVKYKTPRKVNPFTVPHVMASTASANVTVALGVKGESWSISSACSTGAHAIGLATFLIRAGRYERILAGGSDEIDWTRAGAFDAMRALSRRFNDRPLEASRPFDKQRDGFVISGGAGVVLVEDLDSARHRGVPIFAEVLGYAANSDGYEMVAPLTQGAIDVMRDALVDADLGPEDIDYVNAHGTSTPTGDPSEASAMFEVFGGRQPYLSSTKSLSGHALGAAGSLEVIFTVLMMKEEFLARSLNVQELDESCTHLNLVLDGPNHIKTRTALSNSYGFGGTNASLVLRRWDD